MANNFIRTSVLAALMATCVSAAGPALANTEVETAELLIKLVQVGRSLISEHQATINDAGKGDKGFTGDYVANQVVDRFRKATKIDLSRPNSTPQAPLFIAMIESEKEVIDEAQPVINKQGVGFKGLIPAVFARKAGERFYRKTGIRIKLTSTDYRFPGNRPDDFESGSASDFCRHAPSQGSALQQGHDARREAGVADDGSRVCGGHLPGVPWKPQRGARHHGRQERRVA